MIEISQACVNSGGCLSGDDAGFPVTISAPGSYILTSSLSGNHSSIAIQITADRVSLDLNGFSVTMCVGVICAIGDGFDAIHASETTGIRIHNGTVQGSKKICINVGNHAQLRDLNILDCSYGIFTGSYVQISNVNVVDSEFNGVYMGIGSLLTQSTVTGSGSYGVKVAQDGLVVDSIIRKNQGAIEAQVISPYTRGGYHGNVFTENNGNNEDQLIGPALKDLGGNICGTDTACP